MSNLRFLLFPTIVILAALGCKKEPVEAVLPNEVKLGASIVYLNSIEVDYIPDFQYDSINRVMSYGFVQTRNQGQIENLFGFGLLPYKTGEFELTDENIVYVKARASFGQTIGDDSEGYEYKLIDADEGFFHVEYLDTVNLEVKGRFKAKFCRTSKNGNRDLDLPKNLLFQGVFYENYVIKE